MIISSEATTTYELERQQRVGQKFGQLTIVAWESRAKGYLVECDCGNKLHAKYYRLQNGTTRSCRKCFKSKAAGRPLLPDNLGAKRAVITQYRLGAQRRGIPFKLTEAECIDLITRACAYCGLPPSSPVAITTSSAHDAFRYTGIDRQDNTAGYTTENCVPCCKRCNQSKNDMSLDEWKQWLHRVFQFQTSSGTFND